MPVSPLASRNSSCSLLPPRPKTKSKKNRINQGPGTAEESVNGRRSSRNNETPSQSQSNATATISRKRLPDSYRSYNTDNFDLYPNPNPQSLKDLHRPKSCALTPDSDSNSEKKNLWKSESGFERRSSGDSNEVVGYGFRSFPGSNRSGGSPGWLKQKSLSEGNLNLQNGEDPTFPNETNNSCGEKREKFCDKNKTTNYASSLGRDKMSTSLMRENKSFPNFFRSISLRNLLQSEWGIFYKCRLMHTMSHV